MLVDEGFGPDEREAWVLLLLDEIIDVAPELWDVGEGGAGRELPGRMENQISIWLSQEL